MISTKELDIFKAQEQFERMHEFLKQALSEGRRLDEVERGMFPRAMTMCLEFLRSFVEAHGDGDRGETVEREGETLARLPEPHEKRYLSIFGELLIGRRVYGTREGQAIGWSPLDATLGLPAGENSYVLEDWLQRLCIQDAFGGSVESLRAWLGTTVSVRTAEHMSREMSQYVDDFRGEAVPPAEEEEELLVITADGKGVPMRRTLAARLRAESEAGVGRKGRKCRRRGNGRNHGCRGRGAFFASGRAFGGAREKQRGAPREKTDGVCGIGLHPSPLPSYCRRRDRRGASAKACPGAARTATQACVGRDDPV